MIAGYLWNRYFNTLLYIDIIRYNIIYREEPFQIPCSMEREFWEKVHQVRFEFTTETAEEVHAVLKDEIIRDHCRGHFDVGIQ